MPAAIPPPTDVQREARKLGDVLSRGDLRDAFEAAGAFGLLGAHLPGDRGGSEASGGTVAEMWEGAGETGPAGRLFAMAAHSLAVATPIALHGGETLRAEVLPGLLDGTRIGAHAASEAEAGSDAMAMTTSATPDGDGYRLSGSKLWVSNGAEADVFVVLAKTPDGAPLGCVVDRSAEGLNVGEAMDKMGLDGASLTSVYLEEVAVPASHLLGDGRHVFHTAMRYERALIMAPQVGAMRRQLERGLKHARTRRQFGRPIGKNQLVAARVVDMYERYILARGLLRDTASALVDETLDAARACLAKLRLSEWALAQHLDAIRLHGGTGYLEETGLPGHLRDGVGGVLYSGTSDLQRVIIAAHLGL
ncbi:MAG: acyl-CoA dehydrogenase family protein [Sandaracinaceae bacterium]